MSPVLFPVDDPTHLMVMDRSLSVASSLPGWSPPSSLPGPGSLPGSAWVFCLCAQHSVATPHFAPDQHAAIGLSILMVKRRNKSFSPPERESDGGHCCPEPAM